MSWTIKKTECQRIDAFELWCWRRFLHPLDCKEIQPVHPKGDQSWVFIGRTDVEAQTLNTLATWSEELTHWKRPWYWERLKAGGEGDNGGWDDWMALLHRAHSSNGEIFECLSIDSIHEIKFWIWRIVASYYFPILYFACPFCWMRVSTQWNLISVSQTLCLTIMPGGTYT